jgi:hypothetical protein
MIELFDQEGGELLGQSRRLLLTRILPKLSGPSRLSELHNGLGSLHCLSTGVLEGKTCER